MRKIVLGQNPKNFNRTIDVRLPEGGTTKMTVSFIYRTRKEMASFLDEISKFAEANLNQSDLKSVIATIDDNIKSDADSLMLSIDGWELEHEFNRKHVEQFCNEMPDAALDIIDSYVSGTGEVRLGN